MGFTLFCPPFYLRIQNSKTFSYPSKKPKNIHVMVSHTYPLNTAIAKYLHNTRCKIFHRLQDKSNQNEMRDKAGETCEASLELGVDVFVLVYQYINLCSLWMLSSECVSECCLVKNSLTRGMVRKWSFTIQNRKQSEVMA